MTNTFADFKTIDIYKGRVAVNTRRYWYTGWHWCYVAPGFCTIAPWSQPNEHLGLVPESVLSDDALLTHIKPHQLIESPYARFGGLLTDAEARHLQINQVRIGRAQTIVRDGGRDIINTGLNCHLDRDDKSFPSWDRRLLGEEPSLSLVQTEVLT